MGNETARRAIVVGAGIAGLATALRLSRAGWSVLVVERAPGRRSSGYMLNLAGLGYDAAERLSILPALKERDLGWFTSILVKADGRTKFTVPAAVAQAAVGPRMLSAFRGDLESVLYEAVSHEAVSHEAAHERVAFRFGTTVREIEQDDTAVRAVLSDGSHVTADLLVGADGLHSSIRELAFGPEQDFRVDMRHMVGAFPIDRTPAHVPENAGTTFIGPGRTAAVINLGPERSSAFFTYRHDDPDGELAHGPVQTLKSAFGDLGGGVPDALRLLEADPEGAYFDSVSQVVMDRWSQGRVVLVGDAAWCVTLFAGYGAALALAGADHLGTLLEKHDVPAALAEWEPLLRPEVAKRQAMARKGMAQFCPPSQAHVVVRDLMMRAITLPGIRGVVQKSIRRAQEGAGAQK